MKLQTFLLILPYSYFGQSIKTQYINSPIEKVKLFLTSGEMIHQQDITLEKGRNKVIFSGISAFADPQSIRFTSEADYHLLSLSTEMDFIAAFIVHRLLWLNCYHQIQMNLIEHF